ncbi:Cna B-type domain-containing protein [Agathobaculum butyriciproducens]|nr:Cna B-type domain-containing protein [Agathobaculum butyriciproducens]RGC58868.1 Cna B-type domain-containing protein [Agathobaculum butyriciproducens]
MNGQQRLTVKRKPILFSCTSSSRTILIAKDTSLSWGTTHDATTPVAKNWLPTKDQNTLYAIWEAEEYTLNWDANGGTGGSTTTQKYDTVVKPGNAPTRTGYDFDGWYADKACSSPLPSDALVKGNVTYYAKWVPQKVQVNYYDTREGTNLVGSQDYSYDDALHLLASMMDTSGQQFTGWTRTPNGNDKVNDGLALSDGNITKKGNYWVLDLYAKWDEQTTTFTGTVRWDDFTNNDGCRPKSVKLGLVSSIKDELVAEKTVADDGTNEQSVVFDNLPITTSNTSTEKITYKLVFLGYTDADGHYRDIHDTAATSGEIEGSTASKYDDAVYTTYKYALNNYVAGYAGYIKLDHNLITTGDDVKFTIQWKDESDNDGKRLVLLL